MVGGNDLHVLTIARYFPWRNPIPRKGETPHDILRAVSRGKRTVARHGIPVVINEVHRRFRSGMSNLDVVDDVPTAVWNSALSITSLQAPTRFTEASMQIFG